MNFARTSFSITCPEVYGLPASWRKFLFLNRLDIAAWLTTYCCCDAYIERAVVSGKKFWILIFRYSLFFDCEPKTYIFPFWMGIVKWGDIKCWFLLSGNFIDERCNENLSRIHLNLILTKPVEMFFRKDRFQIDVPGCKEVSSSPKNSRKIYEGQ